MSDTTVSPRSEIGTLTLCVLAIVAAGLSIAAQGFQFGIGNNVFHIPVVLDLPAAPQFREDAFYQSLRHFVSVVFPILSLVASERNIAAVFFAAHFVARALTLYALLRLLALAAPEKRSTTLVAAAAFALSLPLMGTSVIAHHDLFVDYFTHSELANSMALLAILAAARGRIILAGILGGIVFDINAFVGVWTAPALAATQLVAPDAGGWRGALRRVAIMAGAFALFATPTIYWILRDAVLAAPSPPFDFRVYLRQLYPLHSFITGRDATTYVMALQLVVLGGVSLALTPRLRAVAVVYATYAGIVACGIAMPYLTANRLLLDLFPMRAEGLLVFLAVVGSAGAALHLAAADRENATHRTLALTVVVTVAVGSLAAAAAALAMLLRARSRKEWALVLAALVYLPALLFPVPLTLPAFPRFFVAISACILAFGVFSGTRSVCVKAGMVAAQAIGGRVEGLLDAGLFLLLIAGKPDSRAAPGGRWQGRIASVAEHGFVAVSLALTFLSIANNRARPDPDDPQLAVSGWARAATDPHAHFLIPPTWVEFQWRAQRRVWVDKRQGAAVMWEPGFYPQWYSRWSEVTRLTTAGAALEYACAHGLDYVIVADTTGLSSYTRYATGRWGVIETARACP